MKQTTKNIRNVNFTFQDLFECDIERLYYLSFLQVIPPLFIAMTAVCDGKEAIALALTFRRLTIRFVDPRAAAAAAGVLLISWKTVAAE